MSVFYGHGWGVAEEGKELCGDGDRAQGIYGMNVNKRGRGWAGVGK